MFRFESRCCPVCREETKMIIQVRQGETDDIPTATKGRPICYKGGRRGICFVHKASDRKV